MSTVLDPNATLPNVLRDMLVALTPDNPSAIAKLRELYDDAVVFRDPIQEVHGIEAFIDMNHRLMKRVKTLSWDIKLTAGNEDVALLEWTMTGTATLGAKIHVDGMTRVRAVSGRIVDHRDYWDLGELIASPLPGGSRILRALRSPLA